MVGKLIFCAECNPKLYLIIWLPCIKFFGFLFFVCVYTMFLELSSMFTLLLKKAS